MVKVKVIPHTGRMKNRVKQHGEIMVLKQSTPHKSLIESLGATWGPQDNRMHWWCWVSDSDATLEIVKD